MPPFSFVRLRRPVPLSILPILIPIILFSFLLRVFLIVSTYCLLRPISLVIRNRLLAFHWLCVFSIHPQSYRPDFPALNSQSPVFCRLTAFFLTRFLLTIVVHSSFFLSSFLVVRLSCRHFAAGRYCPQKKRKGEEAAWVSRRDRCHHV